MLRSFYSGISGLRNHQQAMDVLGNNIANVNTVGFKGSRVTFMDTLSQTIQGGRQAGAATGGTNPTQIGLGMSVGSVGRNFEQGPLQTTGSPMDLAIQGKGFFIVGQGTNFFYTRSGVLGVDNANNIVTSTGDRVYGWMDSNQDGVVDAKTDNLSWINLDRRGDGSITNVNSSVTPAVSGPNLGDASLGTVTTASTTITDAWRIEVTDATTGAFQVIGTKSGPITNDLVTPPSATTTVGQPFFNAKLGSFTLNGGTPHQAVLDVSYDDGAGGTDTITLQAVAFGAGGNDIQAEFVSHGKNQSLSVSVTGSLLSVSLATDANGYVTSTRQEIVDAINAQGGGLVTATHTGSGVDGTAAVLATRNLQDGSGANLGDYFTLTSTAAGGASVQNITISSDGTVLGIFENGTTEEIARIALATIPNPEGLLAIGDAKYAESPTSGAGFPPRMAGTEGTGTLASGFLEMANVDLTQEFTDMIVTQRGFQANSKIITTSDEMLQDLLALKR